MTKQHFIAIADAIKAHNLTPGTQPFTRDQLKTLADCFRSINPAFKGSRWFDYVAGRRGPSGGKLTTH